MTEHAKSKLEQLNALDHAAAVEEFTRCCGSHIWAGAMATHRPFASLEEVLNAADALFAELSPADWLEAFSHHPKIGDLNSLRAKFATTANWASGEQSGTASASDDVLQALAKGNKAYEAKFGYIFIICATGKSAAEMLSALQTRLNNTPEAELPIAGAQQQEITRLRLLKLLNGN